MGLFPDAGFALGGATQFNPLGMEISNGLSTRGDECDVRAVANRGRATVDWLCQSEGIDPDFIVLSVARSRFIKKSPLDSDRAKDAVVELDGLCNVVRTQNDMAQHTDPPTSRNHPRVWRAHVVSRLASGSGPSTQNR